MLPKSEQFEPKPSVETPQENLLRREEEILQKLENGTLRSYDEEYQQFVEEFQKEMKKKGTLIFIYRDNNLFRRYMPIVTKILTEMGYKISVQAFPEGNSEEEIKNWLEKNKELFYQENGFITDETVLNVCFFHIPKTLRGRFKHRDLGISPDYIISEALSKLLFTKSKELLVGEDTLEKNRMRFELALKNILQNPEHIPEKVYIFSSRMPDHAKELDPGLSRYREFIEKQEKAKGWEILELYNQTAEDIANMIKDWLIECGIEPSKIEIITTDISEFSPVPRSKRLKIMKEVDRPKVWVIVDRHVGFKPLASATLFHMPVGNFIHDAMNVHCMLSFSEEEIESSLRETLKRVLES